MAARWKYLYYIHANLFYCFPIASVWHLHDKRWHLCYKFICILYENELIKWIRKQKFKNRYAAKEKSKPKLEHTKWIDRIDDGNQFWLQNIYNASGHLKFHVCFYRFLSVYFVRRCQNVCNTVRYNDNQYFPLTKIT